MRDEHIGKNSYYAKKETKRYKLAKSNFTNFISQLQEKKIKVVLIKDTPLMKTNTPISTCVLQERFLKWNSCDVSKIQDDLTRAEQEKLFIFIQNNFENVYIWDPRENMLNDQSNYSYKSDEGIARMADQHHITENYSLQTYSEFKDFLIKEKIIKFN